MWPAIKAFRLKTASDVRSSSKASIDHKRRSAIAEASDACQLRGDELTMSSGALRTSPNMTSDDVLESLDSLDSNNSLSLFDSSDSLSSGFDFF